MGLRWLLIGIGIWLIFLLLRNQLRRLNANRNPGKVESVDTVQCSYCGVHLPKPEALSHDSRYFCAQNHLQSFLEEKK